ncbi:hypothetical protein COTS27_00279 [Spirochaetota bacterium]|nr:hypothetical protein COTS27_00279 [Spirochaetota bacterium]
MSLRQLEQVLKNTLGREKSSYLKQHATNPVAWQSWGPTALTLAQTLRRPLFVSIGYAACHWCHVMERESFSDDTVAALLNEGFIPIKIDREEHPDIDAIYIRAAECMGVGAGWPLSVFADSNGHPFHIGTYFPPERRHTLPGFKEVLRATQKAWTEAPAEIELHTKNLLTKLREQLSVRELPEVKSLAALTTGTASNTVKKEVADYEEMFTYFGEDRVFAHLQKNYFDAKFGGFKFHGCNKFPSTMSLQLLMRIGYREDEHELLEMSTLTLKGICSGGIFDHVRGGIARYSTDYAWHVPHFEKMLYDNALFIEVLVDSYLRTKQGCYLDWAMVTADYLIDEMCLNEGGFAASQDADSEGIEGKYFLWSYEELQNLLSDTDFAFIKTIFAITEAGNFNGANILYYKEPYEILNQTVLKEKTACDRLRRIKRHLLTVRNKRIPPLTDEKVIVSWNGLVISALARLGTVLSASTEFSSKGEYEITSHTVLAKLGVKYIAVARKAFDFIKETMFDKKKQILYRRYIDGEVGVMGLLTDYANLLAAGLDLYESTFDMKYVREVLEILAVPLKYFWQNGRFFEQDERLPLFIARYTDMYDGVEPTGNSKMTDVLLRLATYDKAAMISALSENVLAAPEDLQKEHVQSNLASLLDVGAVKEKAFTQGTHWGTGKYYARYEKMAKAIFIVYKDHLARAALPYMQRVLHDYRLGMKVLTLHGPITKRKPFTEVIASSYRPGLICYGGKTTGKPYAILCLSDRCLPPVETADGLRELLARF